MTAPSPLTADRKSSIRRVNFGVRPLAASQKVFKNGLASCWGSGSASPGYYGAAGNSGSVATESAPVGRFYETVDNSAGIDGARGANIEFFHQRNFFLVDNDAGNPLTVANRESMVALLDDHTATAQALPAGEYDMGVMYDLDSTYTTNGSVWIEMCYPASSKVDNDDQPPATGLTARCVITALPGAYTGTTTGTLTASANGAIAAQQGVTPVAGDLVWLAKGATNMFAAGYSDAGLYSVVAPGTAGAPYVLQRPSSWAKGSVIPVGASVKIGGEDTTFGGSVFKVYCAKGAVVDTTDPQAYPDHVNVRKTLASGVSTITGIPFRSATKTVVAPTYVSGTCAATTTGYAPGVITAGEVGTGGGATAAAVTVFSYAVPTTPTTTGDSSVLNIGITN